MNSKIYSARCCVLGLTLVAALLLFAFTPQLALACEPTPVRPGYIPPTPLPVEAQVASVIQDTQIVLDGTVKTWSAGSEMDSILTVQVERYLKGHGPKTVKISGYFWVCAPNFAFDKGSRAIFFVNGNPDSTEPLQVRTWFDAQEAVVMSVISSTGQGPIAPDGTYDVIWSSLLVIVVLGLILFMRYRRIQS